MAQKTTGKSSQQVAARRSRVEEMRREQKAKERRTGAILYGVGGLVIVLLVAALVVFAVNRQDKKTAQVLPAAVESTDVTTEKPLVPIADTSGIDGVKAWDTKASTDTTLAKDDPANSGIEHDHVTGPVKYAITPPVGGPHNGAWANAGIYTSAITTERGVHLLEHGTVWITYRPGLPAAQVSALKKLYDGTGDASYSGQNLNAKYLLLTPWADDSLPAPVVISAWGRQLQVQDATDPRLAQFIAKFRVDKDLSYEVPAQTGGEPVSVGGRPDAT